MIKIEDLKDVKSLNEIEGLEIKPYISVLTKAAMIDALIDLLIKKDESGLLAVNSLEKEVKFKMGVVALYTNIELTGDDYYNYDIMKQNNLLDKIIASLDEDKDMLIFNDIENFEHMLEDRIEDKLRENSMDYILTKKVNDVINIFDRTMSHLDGMLDKGDPNIIAKHLSKGVEMIAKKLPDFSQLDITEKLKKVN